jgi:type II secretory pathway component GspD/PulD (secretin)
MKLEIEVSSKKKWELGIGWIARFEFGATQTQSNTGVIL